MNTVFIVGCGYVGRLVAQRELASGRRVLALARSADSAAHLRELGIEPLRGDLDDSASLAALPLAEALVYYFAPPPAEGVEDTRMGNFVASAPRPERVVLISTTGVYGDCGGAWVDESWPPRPQVDRSRRRWSAERQLAAWGVPAVVLRVPGIYGPGRLPLRRLQQGLPVLLENQSPWSNRVHVDDLVAACVAAGESGQPGRTYNVSDGHPSTMTDYFNRVADAVGLARPRQIDREQAQRELSPGMLGYLAESKRLHNRRMREELGVEPRYADLDAGLRACVAAEERR